MSSVSVKRPPKASESKADLVSIEASGSAGGGSGGSRTEEMFTWSRRTPTEKLLVGVVAVLLVALVAVIAVAATRKVECSFLTAWYQACTSAPIPFDDLASLQMFALSMPNLG